MRKTIKFIYIFICLICFSLTNSFAGLGDGTDHPNDVGGFGQTDESTDQTGAFDAQSSPAGTSGNNTGTFGSGTGDQPLYEDPPPDDLPLDGGASLLIAGGLMLGARQIRKKINS